jgi:hypothetical protein
VPRALPKAITRLRRFLQRVEPTHLALSLRLALRYYPFGLGATVDPFQPNLAQLSSMQSDATHRLAITFGLTVTDVRADARDVATWHGANDDDLVAAIGTRRRLGFQAAATYLRDLRTALGRVGGEHGQ